MEDPQAPDIWMLAQPPSDLLRLDLVADLGDSLDVSVLFTLPSDPSGIARIDWRNFGVNPLQDTIAGSTTFLSDTFRVRKPAPATTDSYAAQARAVDGAGNIGVYSAQHPWAIIFQDVVGPPPPGIILDTIVVTATQAVGVWPDSVSVAPGQVAQLYAAVLMSDGSVVCTTGTTDPTILFNAIAFPAACDSAAARLP